MSTDKAKKKKKTDSGSGPSFPNSPTIQGLSRLRAPGEGGREGVALPQPLSTPPLEPSPGGPALATSPPRASSEGSYLESGSSQEQGLQRKSGGASCQERQWPGGRSQSRCEGSIHQDELSKPQSTLKTWRKRRRHQELPLFIKEKTPVPTPAGRGMVGRQKSKQLTSKAGLYVDISA